MKRIFFLICIGLTSCKTIYFTDLKPLNKNSNLLQSLEPLIDIGSLESAYSRGSTKSSGKAYSVPLFGTYFTTASSTSVSFADIRVQDAIVLFDREAKDNITNSIGEKYGYIAFKIIAGGSKERSLGLSVISGLTLCIPNLFGMPFAYGVTSLEIEVEILDSKKNIAGRYDAIGYAKVPVAIGKGYNELNAIRKSNIDAIKNAMMEIKGKINSEYETVNNKLLETGVIIQK